MINIRIVSAKLTAFLLIFLLSPIHSAWSEDSDVEELKAQQQKLRELLDRIGETQDLRGKQRDTLRKLEKQMSCNWELINDYDSCEEKHRQDLEAHIKCKQKAKAKATECLTSVTE